VCRCATPTSPRSCKKCATLKPDALFVFVPSGAGAALMKQFAERGMDKAGIKLIGTGDVTDDDQLERHGRRGAWAWSPRTTTRPRTARPSNKKFVEAFDEGQQRPAPQLHGGGRLRRHARDLRSAQSHQGQRPMARLCSPP
jgi:branched-chain amino acid transport system substrate-binding protein